MELGGWRLTSELGRGANAAVWRAVQGDVSAAVKLMDHAEVTGRDRLVAEVRSLARLEHPAILAIYDHGQTPERWGDVPAGATWIATELADATLHERRPKRWTDLSDLLATLLDALAHAHARGVIHRDLKPANVLWVGAAPRLGDFGIARARAAEGGVPSGSPAWMAPEQATGRWQDEGPWTDLYALGVTAWELICGEPPFTGNTAALLVAHRGSPVPELRPMFPVPDGVGAWIRHLMAKDPRDRPQLAAHALDGLLALDGHRRPVVWSRPVRVRHAGPGLLPIRRPEPVGRDAEIAAVGALVEGLAHGAPRCRVVRLAGPSGIGTSTVAGTVHRRAEESGLALGVAVPTPPSEESAAAAAAFAAAFGLQGLRGAPLRAGLARHGAGPATERLAAWFEAPACPFSELRARMVLALQVLSRQRPVVLRLRDVEHSGVALQLVAGWAERPPAVRAVVVVCGDEDALVAGGRPAWDRIGAAADLDLRLGPLPPPSWNGLVDAWLPLDPDDRRTLAELARGEPRKVAQVLIGRRAGLRWGPRGWQFVRPLPATLGEALSERLDALEPADRRAAEVAAALGVRVDREEWIDAAGLDEWEVDDVEDRLLGSGLVLGTRSGFAFSAGALRDALVTPAAAAAAAVALEGRGGQPGRVARLYAAAGRFADAARHALAAVEDALDREAVAEAEVLLSSWEAWSDAQGFGPGHPHRQRAAAFRLSALALSGALAEVQTGAEKLRDAFDPVARGEALLHLGVLAVTRGGDAEPILQAAEAAFDEAGLPVHAAQARLATVYAALQRGDRVEGRERLDAVAPRLEALDDSAKARATRERAAYLEVELLSLEGRNAEALERLERLPRTRARFSLVRGNLLARVGRTAEAEEALVEAVDEAELGHLAAEAMARVNLGAVLVRLGRPAEGRAQLERALAELAGRPRVHGTACLYLAECCVLLGDRAAAEAALAAAWARPWPAAADGADRAAVGRLEQLTVGQPLAGLSALAGRLSKDS